MGKGEAQCWPLMFIHIHIHEHTHTYVCVCACVCIHVCASLPPQRKKQGTGHNWDMRIIYIYSSKHQETLSDRGGKLHLERHPIHLFKCNHYNFPYKTGRAHTLISWVYLNSTSDQLAISKHWRLEVHVKAFQGQLHPLIPGNTTLLLLGHACSHQSAYLGILEHYPDSGIHLTVVFFLGSSRSTFSFLHIH